MRLFKLWTNALPALRHVTSWIRPLTFLVPLPQRAESPRGPTSLACLVEATFDLFFNEPSSSGVKDAFIDRL